MLKVENAVSITQLVEDWPNKNLRLTNEQDFLLTAIATYIFYECDESDYTIESVIKLLESIEEDHIRNGTRTTFDVLFEDVRKREPFNPCNLYYNFFISRSDSTKIEIRNSCLKLLNKLSA